MNVTHNFIKELTQLPDSDNNQTVLFRTLTTKQESIKIMWHQILDDFVLESGTDWAGKTSEWYLRVLGWFIAHLEQNEVESPEEVSYQDIARFLNGLKEKSYHTRRSCFVVLAQFFKWLETTEKTKGNIFLEYRQKGVLKVPKKPRMVVKAPSHKDIKTLLKQIELRKDAFGVRDLAMIKTMANTGVRREEVVSIKLADFTEGKKGYKIFIAGKGSHERFVFPSESAVAAIQAWLKIRPGVADEHLFINLSARISGELFTALTPDSMNTMISKYCRAAKIERISPHDFRRYYATTYLENGGKIDKLSKLLGHSSIAVTQLYLDSNTANLDAEAYEFAPDV